MLLLWVLQNNNEELIEEVTDRGRIQRNSINNIIMNVTIWRKETSKNFQVLVWLTILVVYMVLLWKRRCLKHETLKDSLLTVDKKR